ncbi:hypothetical protein DPMN_059300 [Dreissena polymorpha]|uniref:Uncharacterized protein n=1 Tax=Dreissena polymorpha TaxID=45954 RepID=A0A9D4C3A4_DREPO|nr:hypothetical protein DPMN_059300 [Dreissena polymorpha]
MGTNLLTKFHEEWKINVAPRVLTRKNASPPWQPCFSTNLHIFQVFQDIIGMNLMTKFHEDQTVNVASRVLTRFYYSYIRKNAPPLGSHIGNKYGLYRVLTRKNAPHLCSHVFQANVTIYQLIQDIKTNLLTKFHEDWTINVASIKS